MRAYACERLAVLQAPWEPWCQLLGVSGDGSPPAPYLLGPQELQGQHHCRTVAADKWLAREPPPPPASSGVPL